MSTAFIDVDGVVADLLPVWLNWYNAEFEDALIPTDITHWDVHRFVKMEATSKIYGYIEDPMIYNEVKPIEGALKGIENLRMAGWKVVFATSTPPTAAFRKFKWLDDYGFKPKKEEYIELIDKSLLSGRGNILLDDRPLNVFRFTGQGYLFTQPHNLDSRCRTRIKDWDDFSNNWIAYMTGDNN